MIKFADTLLELEGETLTTDLTISHEIVGTICHVTLLTLERVKQILREARV